MNLLAAILHSIEKCQPVGDINSYNAYKKYKSLSKKKRELIDDFFKILLSTKFNDLLKRCDGKMVNPLTREISINWWIEDVQAERPDLTDEQASHVLEELKEKHDATIGINWDTIHYVADMLYPQNDE